MVIFLKRCTIINLFVKILFYLNVLRLRSFPKVKVAFAPRDKTQALRPFPTFPINLTYW